MIRRSKWPFASECDDGTYAAASPQNTTGTGKPAPSFAEIDAYAPGGVNGIDRHVGHIRIGIDPAPQSDRIALDMAPCVRVVVAGMIVMQLGVLVEELPREAEIIAEAPVGAPLPNGPNVRPSDLAVLRLMSNSIFTACCTCRSAGFSPLRMRPT